MGDGEIKRKKEKQDGTNVEEKIKTADKSRRSPKTSKTATRRIPLKTRERVKKGVLTGNKTEKTKWRKERGS